MGGKAKRKGKGKGGGYRRWGGRKGVSKGGGEVPTGRLGRVSPSCSSLCLQLIEGVGADGIFSFFWGGGVLGEPRKNGNGRSDRLAVSDVDRPVVEPLMRRVFFLQRRRVFRAGDENRRRVFAVELRLRGVFWQGR